MPSQTAPLAFTTNCGAAASVGPPSGFASASVAATVDFTLQSPQPLGGRLSLRATWGSYGGNSTGAIQLDVAADGVVEFVASQSTPTGIAYDVPVPFGVTTIRVVYQANYVVGFSPNNGGVSISLQAQFFPNEVAVHSFDTTGAGSTLGITHTVPNTVTISLNPNLTPVLLAFGFQPTLVPLGPSVTQLVTLDSLFAVGSMTLILPPLPSGTALYCQGLTYFGAYGSTNSVRAIWP